MNKKKKPGILIMLLMILFLCYGCSSVSAEKDTKIPPPPVLPATDSIFALGNLNYNPTSQVYQLDYGNYPHIDGSVLCRPLMAALAQEHLKLSEGSTDSFISASGKLYIYPAFLNGDLIGNSLLADEKVFMEATPINLLMVPELTESDLQLAKEKGLQLFTKTLAADGLVIITHQNNPVKELTINQVRNIFSGEITNWQEVGGEDLPISPYQDSGSEQTEAYELMYDLVMKDTPFSEPLTVSQEIPSGIPGGDAYTIETVASYRNHPDSIGFALQSTVAAEPDIKLIAINGVYPSSTAVASGEYPLTIYYQGVIKEADRQNTPGQFLNWLVSPEGQTCIKNSGYIIPQL